MVDLLQGGQWTPFREEEDGPGSLLLRAERRRRKQKRNAKREKEKQKILKKTKQNKNKTKPKASWTPLRWEGGGGQWTRVDPRLRNAALKKKIELIKK